MKRALPQSLLLASLVAAGASLAACDATSNNRPDGSIAIGGGGSGGAIGVGGSGGAGGGVVSCGSSGPIDPGALIDDMEAADPATPHNEGRSGSWWAGGDATSPSAKITPNGDATAEAIPGGRCGSHYAEHVTGFGFMSWAVLSVSMGWGAVDAGDAILPFDAQQFGYTGVTFWARIGDTSTNQLRFAISDKYSRPEGGICDLSVNNGDTACYDLFGEDLTMLDTTWHQYRIPFLELTQRHFGVPRPKLDASSIYTIEFDFNPASTFDLWVDDISFY